MARKTYDLSRGSVSYGAGLAEYGVTPLGGRKYQMSGRFISGEQIAQRMVESFQAGAYTFQSPVTGRFQGIQLIMDIVRNLEAGVPFEEWGIPQTPVGKIFQFHFPAGFFGELSKPKDAVRRFDLFLRNRTLFTNAMSDDLREFAKTQIPGIQAVIERVIRERVYNKEPEVIRYFAKGKPTESLPFPKRRTYNLLRAFTEGVSVSGTGITFGVNENLAPYWLWVEKGHRVILPAKVDEDTYIMMETGTFVKGRPFVEAIDTAVQEYMDTVLQNYLNSILEPTVNLIAGWIVHGEDMSAMAMEPKTVKYWPSMGYGKAFEEYVGLR